MSNDRELQGFKKYRESFRLIDRDNKNFISVTDLQTFMKDRMGMNVPLKYVNEMLVEVDRHKSGRIQFADFVTIMEMMKCVQGDEDSELIEAFRVFDTNHDGSLWKGELATVLSTLGEEMSKEELRSMLFLADMDEDGHVDYQEFVRMIFDRK